jgi:hypothetical protein
MQSNIFGITERATVSTKKDTKSDDRKRRQN